MLNFNPEKHEYSLPTGEVLVSVTQVIDRSGLVDTSHFTEFHRLRGQAVHMACEYDDQGCLDESSIDSRILPYVDAYRRFKAEIEFAWEGVEDRRWHRTFRYAGTIDRWGLMHLGGDLVPVVLDLKSGVPEACWGIQLAAYAHLLDQPECYRRAVLRLKRDGKYDLRELPHSEAAEDWSTFVSLMNVLRWKAKHGRAA
ncbi:MAG: hypothetical protein LAP85_14840 [Acidobacteriia bacterium]|nr:hypothetical protein [Terriglobia bacterium]